MSQAPLCHYLDPLRKFDPTISEIDISNNEYIGDNDREKVRARIDEVSRKLESATGRAYREKRVGSDDKRTWEYHNANRLSGGFPLSVGLKHDDIVPIDPSTDTIEVRVGRDSWRDITADEGDEWFLNHDSGKLTIFRLLFQRIHFESPDNRYLRANYRYGVLGGNTGRGGQTELSSDVANSATSLSVEDASRLPASGIVLLHSKEPEYARITDADYDNDTVTVERAVRGTTASTHEAGDIVHYCPESIRSAVAAKAAQELLRFDDWVDQLREASQSLGGKEKMDSWQDEWENTLASNTGVRRM